MEPLVRAATLRGWASLVRELGGDPDALLASARLPGHALEYEDALVPARPAMHLLEASAIALRCPDFGLRMAHAQDPTALGPLALVLQNTPTVREMIQTAAQYLFVHSPSLTLALIPAGQEFPGHVAMRFEMVLDPRPPARQAMDLSLATAHRLLGLVVRGGYRPRAVLLPHSPAAPLSCYVRFFGAEVRPERAHGALIIDELLMDVPLQDVDETIRRIATSYLHTHYPAPGSSTADLVRTAMARTAGGRAAASLEQVASMLALHPRTLQRRLAAEGTSFDHLRDEAVRELAQQYLIESSLSMSHVALALGFSEQSALTRACKRWFGQTPTALRRGNR
ncbi:AraC family transcriptional regulator [Streptomyces sp. SP18BB07]|uniref:AraC family transcriptional regulator n=1 Tax=Streptomyces sp. SP18BB07 TaxID=3002522 RepID=UPI002E774473|nr:AraC family transcriptional regulator [Streptomyces sp. SP18BB07]MEE1765187.1 AraC family transcriptional regulator [Streptomyces sp. SP18BB07]